MTERTADIVADLRGGSRHHVGDGWNEPNPEAADLLERIDALRPPCPTCDGTRWNDNCPDCTDGRMPWERMTAQIKALHTIEERFYLIDDLAELVNYLRSIR